MSTYYSSMFRFYSCRACTRTEIPSTDRSWCDHTCLPGTHHSPASRRGWSAVTRLSAIMAEQVRSLDHSDRRDDSHRPTPPAHPAHSFPSHSPSSQSSHADSPKRRFGCPGRGQSEVMASHPIERKANGKSSSLPKRHINVPIGASIFPFIDQPSAGLSLIQM